MRKIVSIIALMFVLFTCNALDVRHFKYLHKVQDGRQLDLFNQYYVGKVEPQLRMARTVPTHIETIDLAKIMKDYNVEANKPFFLAYTTNGYVYTVFGLLSSDNILYQYFYKEPTN